MSKMAYLGVGKIHLVGYPGPDPDRYQNPIDSSYSTDKTS